MKTIPGLPSLPLMPLWWQTKTLLTTFFHLRSPLIITVLLVIKDSFLFSCLNGHGDSRIGACEVVTPVFFLFLFFLCNSSFILRVFHFHPCTYLTPKNITTILFCSFAYSKSYNFMNLFSKCSVRDSLTTYFRFKLLLSDNFPVGPVVKALCFLCMGCRFHPWLGS